jgi:hypothetical protein
MGLLMMRGIFSTGHFGQAKQCVINTVDTNYLLSADEVMDNILYLAQTMNEELPNSTPTTPNGPAPPISAFVATGRGSHCGRGHINRGGRGGRGLPKCSANGSLNHIMSSCSTSDNALLKWTLAKRKMIVQNHGTHGGNAFAHAALLSDVSTDDNKIMPTLDEYTDEYDDT